MISSVKWTKYLYVGLLLFASFLLEYFSLFVIEMFILKMDIFNYTANERVIHHFIISAIWIVYLGFILFYSVKKFSFSVQSEKRPVSKKDWAAAIAFLLGCKIMTFIDWHTLKIIGEAKGKSVLQFTAQYIYYLLEVAIVLLIVIFGQKAFEALKKKESRVPYGGFLLAVTWGAFHFVSRGVGIEVWNGISCMIFSVFSGMMYLYLRRNYLASYIFIAVGYLL